MNGRRYIKALLIGISASLVFMSPTVSAGWVDQWLEQKTVTPSSGFSGQKRGYFTAGGVSARWRQSNDRLLTITPPRLGGGCGGIDLFLGGFAYMDPEYLVQKLQRLVQAAPALAFSIAMEVMSEKISNNMKEFEAIMDRLNQLQLNDCRLARKVVALADPDDPTTFKDVIAEIDQGQAAAKGTAKGYQEQRDRVTAAGGRTDQNLMESVANCPAEFRAIFQAGSLIDHVAERASLTAFAPIMRGYIGDLDLVAGTPLPSLREVEPCPGNTALEGVDFLEGTAQARATAGACYTESSTALRTVVAQDLTALADAMQNRSAAQGSAASLVNSSSYPIYAVLVGISSVESSPAAAIERATPFIAAAAANRALEDLYQALSFMLDRGASSLKALGVQDPAAQADCRNELATQVTAGVDAMRARVAVLRSAAQASYHRSRRELADNLEVAIREKELKDTADRERIQRGLAR